MNHTCIHQLETDLYVNADGATMPTDAVILCKKKPFIITKELYVDEFLGGGMDVVYKTNDDEFSYLEAQVKEDKAEIPGGLFSNIYRTVMGTCRKTHRKKITGVTNTPVTENK